jgi:hypothetical protein
VDFHSIRTYKSKNRYTPGPSQFDGKLDERVEAFMKKSHLGDLGFEESEGVEIPMSHETLAIQKRSHTHVHFDLVAKILVDYRLKSLRSVAIARCV